MMSEMMSETMSETMSEMMPETMSETMSKADNAFLHVHLDHMQPKSRSQDYAIISGSAIWLQKFELCKNLS